MPVRLIDSLSAQNIVDQISASDHRAVAVGHVTDGQSIRKGDLIMDFDKDKIADEGYDTSACLIFTEPVDGAHIDREPEHTVKAGEKIAVITK